MVLTEEEVLCLAQRRVNALKRLGDLLAYYRDGRRHDRGHPGTRSECSKLDPRHLRARWPKFVGLQFHRASAHALVCLVTRESRRAFGETKVGIETELEKAQLAAGAALKDQSELLDSFLAAKARLHEFRLAAQRGYENPLEIYENS
jgi:hypothetical protein